MASPLWDITLTIASGPDAGEYGFMLVTPAGKTKELEIREVGGPPADRISTEAAASYLDFEPLFDTPFVSTDWEGGAGQLDVDEGAPENYLWGSGVVTHSTGMVYLAPPAQGPLALTSATGPVDGMVSYYDGSSGVRYDFAWQGVRLYRRNASNASNTWALVYTASADITDFEIFNGRGYIAVPSLTGTTDFLEQANLTAAATWTPTTYNHTVFSDANGKPKLFLGIRGTLMAAVDNRKVYFTVDPTSDSWAGPIVLTVETITSESVGDNTYPFTGMTAVNDYVFAFKQSAGYSIDSEQNVTEVFWQWKDYPDPSNFKYLAKWQNLLVFSVGNDIYTYDPGTGITLPLDLSRQPGFSVREILGLAADMRYVYALARVRVPIIRSAESVALIRLHRTGITWHPEVLWEDTAITGKNYGFLAALPKGEGSRLYWGKEQGSNTDTYVMDIPADWDETTTGSYATSGELYTSNTRALFPGLDKRHLWTNVEGRDFSATESVRVDYSLDFGASFTTLMTATASPALAELNDVASRVLMLRLVLSGDGTATPVVRSVDHHQRVRFRRLEQVLAPVRVADNLERRNSSRDNKTAATLKANLQTLRTTNAKITYEDYLGHSFPCTVDVLHFKPTRQNSQDPYELEATLAISRANSGD